MHGAVCKGLERKSKQVRATWEAVKRRTPNVQAVHVEPANDYSTKDAAAQMNAVKIRREIQQIREQLQREMYHDQEYHQERKASCNEVRDSAAEHLPDQVHNKWNSEELKVVKDNCRSPSTAEGEGDDCKSWSDDCRTPSTSEGDGDLSPEETPEAIDHLNPKGTSNTVSVTFRVKCQTAFGDEVRVIGNVSELGQWDPSNAAKMQWTDGHMWVATVDLECPLTTSGNPLEFKYVLISNGNLNSWECGENRVLPHLCSGSEVVCNDVWGSKS